MISEIEDWEKKKRGKREQDTRQKEKGKGREKKAGKQQ